MLETVQIPIRILRIKRVIEKTGETQSQIYAKMAKDEFPRPVKLSMRCVGWVEAEVDLYLKQKIAKRDADLAAIHAQQMRLSKRRARAA